MPPEYALLLWNETGLVMKWFCPSPTPTPNSLWAKPLLRLPACTGLKFPQLENQESFLRIPSTGQKIKQFILNIKHKDFSTEWW